MVSLAVVVLDVLVDEASEMILTERNHSVETLVPDRPDEPLGIGVEVGTPRREADGPDTATVEGLLEDTGVQGNRGRESNDVRSAESPRLDCGVG